MTSEIHIAVSFLKQGKIIAYPTEAMFGIGCDVMDEKALTKIIKIKKRPPEKGLIIVAARWEQVQNLTQKIPDSQYKKIFQSWPGHTTWLFPAAKQVPTLITGKHNTIAIRVSNNPTITALCEQYGKPIVSTSANIHNGPTAMNDTDVTNIFGGNVDYIVSGKFEKHCGASKIIDAITGKVLRL
ncbi:MAG: threonylcarbamoyl-AMP synthase [Legionellales bacterium]|jgi:L-threonylcarbamoyladenylate synthase|nr:threonylcarbamoyl-AMP synthase [Legionellales bacterium]